MKCSEVDASLDAYIDGELAGVDRDFFERHILACDPCFRASRVQARFKAAVRGHLPRREVPEGLRRRLELALVAAPPPPRRWVWQMYPRMFPSMAGALMLMLVAGASVYRGRHSAVIDQALLTYQAAIPMDVTNSDCGFIADWFRKHLDFAVTPPPLARRGNCQGGRLVNLDRRFGAYFEVLTTEGQKVGVLVFDGEDEPVSNEHRVLNGMNVYMGRGRGASTMSFRYGDGLNYVVTADLDEEHLTHFLPAALR